MILKTKLFGKTYEFKDVKEVLAKANEEKSGDKLAGIAAETAEERVAAKVVLSYPTKKTKSPALSKTTSTKKFMAKFKAGQ